MSDDPDLTKPMEEAGTDIHSTCTVTENDRTLLRIANQQSLRSRNSAVRRILKLCKQHALRESRPFMFAFVGLVGSHTVIKVATGGHSRHYDTCAVAAIALILVILMSVVYARAFNKLKRYAEEGLDFPLKEMPEDG